MFIPNRAHPSHSGLLPDLSVGNPMQGTHYDLTLHDMITTVILLMHDVMEYDHLSCLWGIPRMGP